MRRYKKLSRAKRDNEMLARFLLGMIDSNYFHALPAKSIGWLVRLASFSFWDESPDSGHPLTVGALDVSGGGIHRLAGEYNMEEEEFRQEFWRWGKCFCEERDGLLWFSGYMPRSDREGGLGKAPIPTDLRWKVWERDEFTCQKCGTRRNLSIDHITPESRGGTLDINNLRTLCVPCNSARGNRMEVQCAAD